MLLAGALALSCALPGVGGPSSDQLLRDALQGLRSARSFHVTGSVTLGLAYWLDLVVEGANLEGTIGDGRVSVAVRRTGDRVFEHGARYFHLNGQPLVSDDYWVLNSGSAVGALVQMLSDWRSLVHQLQSSAGSVSQAPGPLVDGRRAVWLIGDGLSVLVDEQGARVPVGLTTTPGRMLASHLSDLSLTFDRYGAATAVATPAPVIDLADRNTLPVHDVPDTATFKFEGCDTGGCTLASDVVNQGGRQGSATAMFRVSRAGQLIRSCQLPVSPLNYQQRIRLSCRLNYDASPENAGGVLVTNPDGVA
jgi:hypothetical protein